MVCSMSQESSDESDDESDDSDEEISGSASSSSSEDDFEKFSRKKKSPARENPPVIKPDSGKPFCELCPDWFNDYATERNIFIAWHDIEIHHKIWHNSKYMPDKCQTCCFRAENLTALKDQHDKFPELCKILTRNKTYIRLEEHLEGGGSGRRGRKSRNTSGRSIESLSHIESQPIIRKPSSISPKLPKPSIPKPEKKLKKPNSTSEINIPTMDLTLSPSPDRSASIQAAPSDNFNAPSQSPLSISLSNSTKSNKSSKNSTPISLIDKSSKAPSPIEGNVSLKSLQVNIPEESSSKEDSPKPDSKGRWTFEEKIDVNEDEEGEAKYTCDECNINELACGKFKKLQLERHKKLWHSDYTYTSCKKCNQRFETIADMNNSVAHQSTCVVYQAGNVLVSVYHKCFA